MSKFKVGDIIRQDLEAFERHPASYTVEEILSVNSSMYEVRVLNSNAKYSIGLIRYLPFDQAHCKYTGYKPDSTFKIKNEFAEDLEELIND